MKEYHYLGLNRQQAKLQGQIRADSKNEAAQKLIQMGISPIYIQSTPKTIMIGDMISRLIPKFGIHDADIMMFFVQMISIVRSNINMNDGLKTVLSMTQNRRFAGIIQQMILHLESGHSLTQAFYIYKAIFGQYAVSLIAMGERTGNLNHAFVAIQENMEEEQSTHRKIWLSFRYPLLVMLFIAAAMVILNIYVIPMFSGFFQYYAASLPWPTQFLITVSDFLVKHGYRVFMVLVFSLLVLLYYLSTAKGKYRFDYYKIKMPLWGKLVKQQMTARFAQQLSHALSSNVPMLTAIQVIGETSNNYYFRAVVQKLEDQIQHGDSFSCAIRSNRYFEPLMIQMVQVGEQSGQLEHALREVARYYRSENQYALALLTQRLEPVLMMIVAGFILLLAMGVFLPMWDISSVVMKKI